MERILLKDCEGYGPIARYNKLIFIRNAKVDKGIKLKYNTMGQDTHAPDYKFEKPEDRVTPRVSREDLVERFKGLKKILEQQPNIGFVALCDFIDDVGYIKILKFSGTINDTANVSRLICSYVPELSTVAKIQIKKDLFYVELFD